MILTMVTEEHIHRFSNPDRINVALVNDIRSPLGFNEYIKRRQTYYGKYWIKTFMKMLSRPSLETDLSLNPNYDMSWLCKLWQVA